MDMYNSFLVMSPQVIPATTATMDDVQITASIVVVQVSTFGDQITGFIPPVDFSGGVLYVANASTDKVMYLPNNTGSTPGYRIILPDAYTSLMVDPGQTATLIFIHGVGWRPVLQPTALS